MKIKRAAGILFTDGSKVLLLQKAKGKNSETWGLPAGKAETGESALENAKRETMEETGLTSIPGEQFDSYTRKTDSIEFTCFLYKVSKPFEVKLSKEHSASTWCPITSLNSIKLLPQLKGCLPLIMEKLTPESSWQRFKKKKDIT